MTHLVLTDVSKAFAGGITALRGVSLDIGPGMFGLLGPNGAGKSTLMRVIATLLQPDTGSVRWSDIDVLANPAAVRAHLGYLPQEFGLYPNVPVQDTLSHFAALKGISPGDREGVVAALLERTNLLDVRHRAAGTLSGGMRQRLGVAITLAGDPQLLILDEPTAGLDPAERWRLYDLLAEIADQRVVLLSTHLVDDVRALCREMAVMRQGRVVARGVPALMVKELRGKVWSRPWRDGDTLGDHVMFVRRDAGMRMTRLFAEAQPAGAVAVEPDLEDVYFSLVGSQALS